MVQKHGDVSDTSHPLGVGNLKSTFADVEIFQASKQKAELLTRCQTIESIKWHWKCSDYGLRLCCSEKDAEMEILLEY